MKIIATLTISIAIFLIAIALFNISRQKLFIDNCSKEFRNTIKDAESIKQELENLMENSVELSRLIVDHIDGKIAHADSIAAAREEETAVCPPENNVIMSTAVDMVSPAEAPALRVKAFELAKELGMSSKELISLLREMGHPVSHHMKLLDERVVQLVREEVLLRSLKNHGEAGNFNKSASPETQIANTGTSLTTIPVKKLNDQQRLEEHQHLALVTRNDESCAGKANSEESILDFSVDDLKSAHPYLAVRSLDEKGLTVKEIAKLLDRGQGEVSLILNLARKKQACV